jgi:hypothetical protein
LVGQRIFGLVLGYEDLNNHDELRKDPTFGVLAGSCIRLDFVPTQADAAAAASGSVCVVLRW